MTHPRKCIANRRDKLTDGVSQKLNQRGELTQRIMVLLPTWSIALSLWSHQLLLHRTYNVQILFLPGQHSFSVLVKAPLFSYGGYPIPNSDLSMVGSTSKLPRCTQSTGLHIGALHFPDLSDWLRCEFMSQIRPKRLYLGKFVEESILFLWELLTIKVM